MNAVKQLIVENIDCDDLRIMMRTIVNEEISKMLNQKQVSDDIATRKQVLIKYDISETNLWKKMRAGEIPFFRIGRKIFFRLSEIEAVCSKKMEDFHTGHRGRPRKIKDAAIEQ